MLSNTLRVAGQWPVANGGHSESGGLTLIFSKNQFGIISVFQQNY